MTNYVSAVAALLFLASASHGQPPAPKESLRGLSGVYVNVPEIDADVQKAGLTTKAVRERVEAQLREAGITIHKEPQPADGDANLTVVVDFVRNVQGVYVFKVGVSLVQSVRLVRDPKGGTFPSETWSAVALGLTTAKRLDVVHEPLKEKLGEFTKDYAEVNAKNKK